MINVYGMLKFIDFFEHSVTDRKFYMQAKVRFISTLFTVLLTLTGLSQNALAGGIDFRVGSEAAELSYLTQNSSFGYGGADIGFGVLFNEDNDVLLTGSALVTGSSTGEVQGLHFGVGGKAYGGVLNGPNDSLDIEGGAIAIGAGLRFVFSSSVPVAIVGEVYFAPEVTSIADFDGLLEYRAGIELEVTPSARAYLGYRKLEVSFNDDFEYDVDDNAHVGVRFEF